MLIQPLYLPNMRNKISFLIILTSCFGLVGLVWNGPIVQDPSYHQFADQRTLFNLPNFWNVVTNLPFIVVGIFGLCLSTTKKNDVVTEEVRKAYTCFFAGILFTGITSAFYHLWPGNSTLFWDRLTMAISFMAFLAIVIGSFVNNIWGGRLLLPLVIFGMFSVVYWIVTEQQGDGDLRLYVLTQFLTPLVIATIISSRSAPTITARDIIIIGAGYVVAKLFELFDVQVYQIILFSGHSLKHVAAAFSAYWVSQIYRRGHNENQSIFFEQIQRRRQI